MSDEGPRIACACGCGQMIQQFDDDGRERQYVRGHNIAALWKSLRSTAPRS